MAALKDDVLAALGKISGPDGVPLPASGKLSEIVAADGKVFFSISVEAAAVKQWESVRERAEAAVRAVPGVTSAMVALTAERAGGAARPQPAQRPQPRHSALRNARHRERRQIRANARLRRPAFPAWSRSSRSPQAKAASANRPPRSTSRSGCATSGSKLAFSTPTFTARRCRSSSPSARSRRPSAARA